MNMKVAEKSVDVYNSTGEWVIGSLNCGDAVFVMEENAAGTLIAYIPGFVKAGDAAALVSAEEWRGAADMRQTFVAYIAAQVGALYVSGGQGQTATPALIRRLEKDDGNYRRAMASYNAHAAAGASLVCYDCSGLIVKFLLDNKLIVKDKTANGLFFDECGAIERSELQAGDLMFKKYALKNQMYHVGVYMGDGSVVHAKGRDDGVVRESADAAGWNRFGRLKCWRGAFNAAGYTRLLKNGGKPYMRGDDVRRVQQALENKGYDAGGADGIYGPKTEQAVKLFQKAAGLETDGVVGPKTWAALIGQPE